MSRLILKTSLVLMVCATIFTAVGIALGQSQRGEVFTVSSMQPPVSDVGLTIIDADKGISLPVELPIYGVRDIILSPDGRRALLMSGGVQVRLHVYDLFTGDIYSAPNAYSLVTAQFSEDPKPEWSADSRYVTFLNAFIPGQDTQGLYVIDFANRQTTRLHHITAETNWSPDNRTLAFASDGDIHTADVQTGELINWTEDDRWYRLPAWAYDSSLIFAGEDFDEERTTIYRLMPADGELPQDITPEFQATSAPVLSPDRQWMTFTAWVNDQPALYNMHLPTGETFPLESGFTMGLEDVNFVTWAPDSQSLLIGKRAQGMNHVSIRLSTPQGITGDETLEQIYFMGWGADSEYFMYSVGDNRSGIFRLNLYLTRADAMTQSAQELISDAEFSGAQWGQEAGSLAYILRETRQTTRTNAVFTSRLYARNIAGDGHYLTVPGRYAMSFAYWE